MKRARLPRKLWSSLVRCREDWIDVDGDLAWNAQRAMISDKLTELLLIVGSGAIRIEFSSFYSTFRVDVTIIGKQETILSLENEDISNLVQVIFTREGIETYRSTLERIGFAVTRNAIFSRAYCT